MTEPLVSVIVPVLNVARLLPRCLDSLLAQTHRPLEIIVVNDGSTDGSAEAMLGHAQRHPEVQVIGQPNRGVGPARLHLSRFPVFAWNRLYRRDLFPADARPFPAIYYEDLATTPLVLARASKVVIVRKVYYHDCLRDDSITGNFGAKNVFAFAAAIGILRHDLHQKRRWQAWRPSYRRLLRESLVMIAAQILFQRNRIPLRVRGPLLVRFARRLRALSPRPGDPRVHGVSAAGNA